MNSKSQNPEEIFAREGAGIYQVILGRPSQDEVEQKVSVRNQGVALSSTTYSCLGVDFPFLLVHSNPNFSILSLNFDYFVCMLGYHPSGLLFVSYKIRL